jgi:hypothetical protein
MHNAYAQFVARVLVQLTNILTTVIHNTFEPLQLKGVYLIYAFKCYKHTLTPHTDCHSATMLQLQCT